MHVCIEDDGHVTRRDTTMTFMTFVNCDLFNAYTCRSADRCFYEMSLFENISFVWAIGGSILGQLAVIYFPPLQEVFQTEALRLLDLVYIIILSSTVLALDTIRKKFFKRLFADNVISSFHKKSDCDIDSSEQCQDTVSSKIGKAGRSTMRNRNIFI